MFSDKDTPSSNESLDINVFYENSSYCYDK